MDEWKKPDIGRHYLPGLVMLALLVLFGWLYYDTHRNAGLHHNTDGSMADIDNRMQRIESRIDGIQKRIDQAEKTINGTLEAIGHGRENAQTVADGIGRAEERLDSAISRSQRIQAIIDEIERTNQKGTSRP